MSSKRLTLTEAPHRPDLEELFEAARKTVITPEMYAAQRRSWVVGNMGILYPDRTREDLNTSYDHMMEKYGNELPSMPELVEYEEVPDEGCPYCGLILLGCLVLINIVGIALSKSQEIVDLITSTLSL